MGQSVRVNDDVRPPQYRSRTGVVTEVRGGEIGVNLGSANSHNSASWFRPHELSLMDIGQTRHEAAERHAMTRRGAMDPEVAS